MYSCFYALLFDLLCCVPPRFRRPEFSALQLLPDQFPYIAGVACWFTVFQVTLCCLLKHITINVPSTSL